MDRCVLLTSTPECVVSPRQAITRAQPKWWPGGETTHSGCALVIARRGETTHSGVDVNNTYLSMINPLNKACGLQILWDVISCPYPWSLLLAHKSPYIGALAITQNINVCYCIWQPSHTPKYRHSEEDKSNIHATDHKNSGAHESPISQFPTHPLDKLLWADLHWQWEVYHKGY